MKVAITSTGDSLDEKLDQRFGRCAYFVIYNSITGGMEFLPNPNRDLEIEAGTASVKLLSSRNIEKIISGEFGERIKPILDSLKIQMIVIKTPNKTIREIIDLLRLAEYKNHKD